MPFWSYVLPAMTEASRWARDRPRVSRPLTEAASLPLVEGCSTGISKWPAMQSVIGPVAEAEARKPQARWQLSQVAVPARRTGDREGVTELKAERDRIDRAIALEGTAAAPRSPKPVHTKTAKPRHPRITAEARKRMSEAQKRRPAKEKRAAQSES
jgi:hypothetical protein